MFLLVVLVVVVVGFILFASQVGGWSHDAALALINRTFLRTHLKSSMTKYSARKSSIRCPR